MLFYKERFKLTAAIPENTPTDTPRNKSRSIFQEKANPLIPEKDMYVSSVKTAPASSPFFQPSSPRNISKQPRTSDSAFKLCAITSCGVAPMGQNRTIKANISANTNESSVPIPAAFILCIKCSVFIKTPPTYPMPEVLGLELIL